MLFRSKRSSFAIREALATRLAVNGSGVREYYLMVGLAILRELGLVQYFPDGDTVKFILQPRPREKLQLDLSPTYGRVHKLVHKLVPWQHNMVELPADRLKLLYNQQMNIKIEGAG